MMLDNTLWEQTFSFVTSDADSSIILVQIVPRFIRKCSLFPLGAPSTVLLSPQKSQLSDSVIGESYVEYALHAFHAAADGDELWN